MSFFSIRRVARWGLLSSTIRAGRMSINAPWPTGPLPQSINQSINKKNDKDMLCALPTSSSTRRRPTPHTPDQRQTHAHTASPLQSSLLVVGAQLLAEGVVGAAPLRRELEVQPCMCGLVGWLRTEPAVNHGAPAIYIHIYTTPLSLPPCARVYSALWHAPVMSS